MTRADVVALLEEYATLLDLINEDEFRAKAFANAARQLDAVSVTLDELMVGDRLSKVRGVGASVAQAIREAAESGTFADLENARARVPSGVFDLMKVEGLGPKKARTLWKEANVASLADLEAAIAAGTLTKFSGFGGKTVEKFRASLEFLKKTGGRKLRHQAKAAAVDIEESLRLIPGVLSAHFCGSLRRCMETVGDLDCIVCADPAQHDTVKKSILALGVVEWTSTEDQIWSGKHSSGMDVELSVCAPDELGTRLVLATGSKLHVAELQSRGEIPIAATEEDVYRSLNLQVVPPALREENLVLRDSNQPLPWCFDVS